MMACQYKSSLTQKLAGIQSGDDGNASMTINASTEEGEERKN